MTNSEKFKDVFGIYATELWAMPEKDLLNWINAEYKESESAQPEIIRCKDCAYVDSDATCSFVCGRKGMGLKPYHVHHDDYCSYAERKTDEADGKTNSIC